MTNSAGRIRSFLARLSLLLAFPLLLAACASNAPRDTNFDWDLVSDGPSSAAHNSNVDTAPAAETDEAPKQLPGWYNQTKQPPVSVSPLPEVTGSLNFDWPVQGKVISEFGSLASGVRNAGINIETALGTPIHAAADGVVSYTGNELKGYGNLILIRHTGDYVTAYAHAETVLVARGARVVRGQVIAYAGTTGGVDVPQLHFEIRHGTAPVNPRPLLVASR